MAKYYVESGQVRVIFDAANALEAAVKTFQWTCDRQAGIDTEWTRGGEAEERAWELEDEIRVSEVGFGRADADRFDTLNVVVMWQACRLPWVG